MEIIGKVGDLGIQMLLFGRSLCSKGVVYSGLKVTGFPLVRAFSQSFKSLEYDRFNDERFKSKQNNRNVGKKGGKDTMKGREERGYDRFNDERFKGVGNNRYFGRIREEDAMKGREERRRRFKGDPDDPDAPKKRGPHRRIIVRPNRLPPRPTIDESEFTEVFIKGGGPGGQKINKTNSKVQLKHIEYGIVVDCQETRSREQNRKIAREKLALEVDAIRNPKFNRKIALEAFERKKAKLAREKTERSREKMEKLKRQKEELAQREEEARQMFVDPEVDYELLEYQTKEVRDKILAESRERMLRKLEIEEQEQPLETIIAGVVGQLPGHSKEDRKLEKTLKQRRKNLERNHEGPISEEELTKELEEQDFEQLITGSKKTNRSMKTFMLRPDEDQNPKNK
ncbi:Peptide chain release factor 1 [Wickerhamomyces ciferrii]|uniref:Peptide chain release factor 1 n=1 Tax=Wickerhamomyces ciferrii (strain ATCC 14091 / BCRC 22168 / CBS 111 / JCM 3599 / NBRC 0793 / NRRL Y-1031 F-60-10) TaxID=1206466 RepID=K0KXW7_WICCF|nr:Peptide chain release factor 1 [Wickerhamomyces ciferrii]CCH46912.1 Peptide chain release factor 1 [Wickerhamomyces ciferrii]